jgi:hypothetical protein
VGAAPSPTSAAGGTSAVAHAPSAVITIAQRLQQGLSQALKLPSHQELVGLLGSRDSLSHLSQQASEAQQQVTTPPVPANQQHQQHQQQQQQRGWSSAAEVPAPVTASQAWVLATCCHASVPAGIACLPGTGRCSPAGLAGLRAAATAAGAGAQPRTAAAAAAAAASMGRYQARAHQVQHAYLAAAVTAH